MSCDYEQLIWKVFYHFCDCMDVGPWATISAHEHTLRTENICCGIYLRRRRCVWIDEYSDSKSTRLRLFKCKAIYDRYPKVRIKKQVR